MCAKFQLMPKIKIQLLKISQGTYIKHSAKFGFDWVRLSWFFTMFIFIGAENLNVCQISADAKSLIQILKIIRGT